MNKSRQEILEVAEQLFWWEKPEKAIQNRKRLIILKSAKIKKTNLRAPVGKGTKEKVKISEQLL